MGPGLAAPLGSPLFSEPRKDQGAPTSAPAPRTPELTLCPACLPGYQVSWEVYGQSTSRLTLTLNSSTHEYKIQGLSSLTTYTIDVAAVTAAGAGVPTSSTISSGVPPGQYARAPVSPQPCPLGLALALSWWASSCRSHWGPLKEGCQPWHRMVGVSELLQLRLRSTKVSSQLSGKVWVCEEEKVGRKRADGVQ